MLQADAEIAQRRQDIIQSADFIEDQRESLDEQCYLDRLEAGLFILQGICLVMAFAAHSDQSVWFSALLF